MLYGQRTWENKQQKDNWNIVVRGENDKHFLNDGISGLGNLTPFIL